MMKLRLLKFTIYTLFIITRENLRKQIIYLLKMILKILKIMEYLKNIKRKPEIYLKIFMFATIIVILLALIIIIKHLVKQLKL